MPQLSQTISSGKTRDLNVWTLTLMLVVYLMIAWYGYKKNDLGFLALGTWLAIYGSLLAMLKWSNLSRCPASF